MNSPSLPSSDLVAIDPVDVLREVDGGALVEGRDLGDGLGEQLGQRHPHLLLHQRQPLVDLGVIRDRDWRLVQNLFSLPGRDPQNLGVVFIQQDARHAGKHLLEVFLELGHVLAVPDDLQQVLVSHKVEPVSKVGGQKSDTERLNGNYRSNNTRHY